MQLTTRGNKKYWHKRSRAIREQICYITEHDDNIRIFKNDPISSFIPRNCRISYKNEVAWDFLQITNSLNMECWRLITECLFDQHSHVLFSLIFQLSSRYRRDTLAMLTTDQVTYAHIKQIANIFNINILLYKPNYIPQYLRVQVHYLNLIRSDTVTLKTMLVYTQPIECLHSLDFHFQLDSLRDLRFEEKIQCFFDLSQCLIDITDFDTPLDVHDVIGIQDAEQIDAMKNFKHKFDSRPSHWSNYQTFVALWCETDNPADLPDAWWPDVDLFEPLPIDQFVLLLIKVSTTYSGMGVIIHGANYYCICKEDDCADIIICQIYDDGWLSVPDFRKSLFGTLYKRKPLKSLIQEHKHLCIY